MRWSNVVVCECGVKPYFQIVHPKHEPSNPIMSPESDANTERILHTEREQSSVLVFPHTGASAVPRCNDCDAANAASFRLSLSVGWAPGFTHERVQCGNPWPTRIAAGRGRGAYQSRAITFYSYIDYDISGNRRV